AVFRWPVVALTVARHNPSATAADARLNSGSTTSSIALNPVPSGVSCRSGAMAHESSVIGAEAFARSPMPSHAPATARPAVDAGTRYSVESVGPPPDGASVDTT